VYRFAPAFIGDADGGDGGMLAVGLHLHGEDRPGSDRGVDRVVLAARITAPRASRFSSR
jgi:hypothetical protein